jgi:hypothetical protein
MKTGVRRWVFRLIAAVAILGAAIVPVASSASAAVTAPAAYGAACQEFEFTLPAGNTFVLMAGAGTGVRFLVQGISISQSPVVSGYAEAWVNYPGQSSFNYYTETPLNAEYPAQISTFGAQMIFSFQTHAWIPEVIYNSCLWTAQYVTLT